MRITKEEEVSVQTISPYRKNGTWVFDDPAKGVKDEPFVCGAPEILDALVKKVLRKADKIKLSFSTDDFDGAQMRLHWVAKGSEGNFYSDEHGLAMCWLCPVLYKYFEKAPAELWVKVEENDDGE